MRLFNSFSFIVAILIGFASQNAFTSINIEFKAPKGVEELFQRNPTNTPVKIIGLVPAHNEQNVIAHCLQALSLYTDAIVYLDDASDDNTLAIVESLKESCNVASIIRKSEWYRDEPGDRNALLREGRKLGGTHFIVLDADELLTANCLDNQFLRTIITTLRPGESLALNWIQLWRSTNYYRFDKSVWTWNYKSIIFCDDRNCFYDSAFIHTARIPKNLKGKVFKLEGYDYGFLHFQFVNWENLLVKQAWYRCLERVRDPKKSCKAINERYQPSVCEKNIHLEPAPIKWFEGYPFFDASMYHLPVAWREEQILAWFAQYGKEYFAGLDIWNIDWQKKIHTRTSAPSYHSQSGQDKYIHTTFFKNKPKGTFVEIGANNGIKFSNTYFFEKHLGWHGICIEPMPTPFEELQKNRNCICVKGCITDMPGTKDFLLITGYSQMLSGLLEKYDPRHLERINKELVKYGGEQKVVQVECYRLIDLLQRYDIKSIDYVSIDTEGGELEILKSIDYDAVEISIISVENNYNTRNIYDFLVSKGYLLKTKLGDDEIYQRRK